MALIENTLWGQKDKVQIAIERLRQYEPPDGYYLAFSGGKDSITIYELAEMSGVQFDAHYNVTTVDPPELVQFIKDHYPQVERHRPEMSMFRLITAKHRFPPMRTQRWCCEELKEGGGAGRIVVTGIRWAESQSRSRRKLIESCFKDKSKVYLNPIIDWSDADVWEFIDLYDLPYCSLYDEGFHRLGCILCPMARAPERDIARWPQFAKAFRNTFARVIEIRKERGLKTSFKTGDEMFRWWIKRNTKGKPDPRQARLFD